MTLEITQTGIDPLGIYQVVNSLFNTPFNRFGHEQICGCFVAVRDFGDDLPKECIAIGISEEDKSHKFILNIRSKNLLAK